MKTRVKMPYKIENVFMELLPLNTYTLTIPIKLQITVLQCIYYYCYYLPPVGLMTLFFCYGQFLILKLH
jgi:hypothetical protein